MNIGIVIKEIRKQKGLTQLELANYADLSERTIQRIENHEVEPIPHSLKRIGEILEVDLIGIKAKNSSMFTSEILGIQLKDMNMNQSNYQNVEQRLEKIEAHLASIARTRNIQLQNRKRLGIAAAILAGMFIIIEILAEFRVL